MIDYGMKRKRRKSVVRVTELGNNMQKRSRQDFIFTQSKLVSIVSEYERTKGKVT
jgi:hypothetical protein